MVNFLYLPLTIIIFILAGRLQNRFPFPLFNPVLITLTVLVLGLLYVDIPYQSYNEYSGWLTKLLEPAVVALGVPLYKQLHAIRHELPRICITIIIAVCVAVSSSVILALLVGASPEIAISIAPKSVTTPIAVLICEQVNGQPAITAIAVLITGLVGVIIGLPVLRLCGVHSKKAQGIAMGAVCHALGTARIAQEGYQQGAYGALALVLSATFSAVLCPVLVPLLI